MRMPELYVIETLSGAPVLCFINGKEQGLAFFGVVKTGFRWDCRNACAVSRMTFMERLLNQ